MACENRLVVLDKSEFALRLASGSGIEELMEDLGRAMAGSHGEMRMLGGGNPAPIPEIQALWRQRMQELLADQGAFDRMLGNYDPPAGNAAFLDAVAGLLRREFGWDLTRENIAITAGGQTAFFFLFNLLAGRFGEGRHRKILLPLVPEYIGYANQGLSEEIFRAVEPRIEKRGRHEFKYHIDFDKLRIDADVGAVCFSRPTNPSGNVLTDTEVRRLDTLAREAGVPLIIDNAYGTPFPGILFREATPIWNENIILTLSLSKLGLPGTRTGIVVARPEIIRSLGSLNAVVGLANGNVGQILVRPLLENGEILRLSREVIRPFYERKAALAKAWIVEFFDDDLDYFVHASEGALFLWLWFPGMKIPAETLYQRLKARGVLIVPGHYFGVGAPADWQHGHQCIRLSFAMDEKSVREGIAILAEEVKAAS
jgi:valine--pyruvate aminotransferase